MASRYTLGIKGPPKLPTLGVKLITKATSITANVNQTPTTSKPICHGVRSFSQLCMPFTSDIVQYTGKMTAVLDR
ncbi:hypothetical protein FEI15_00285 [Lacticaseibacillus zeae]|uniref:Uncharacterized protein n=1 Tax=Lacticaseibacillus zeae TaxID=57037 RepID=A0A5R8LWM7_LACZE|nr:hypothetical protein FEI15_00285 [Lacticaseibacillus zeae]